MDVLSDCCNLGSNVLVMCRCIQQCFVEHSHIRRSDSGRLPSTPKHLKIHALCEQRWSPGSASRDDIRAQFSTTVLYLCSGYHWIPGHCQAQLLFSSARKWNGTLLPPVMRVGPVCTGWRRSCEPHLPECIRPWQMEANPSFMGWKAITHNSQSHFTG